MPQVWTQPFVLRRGDPAETNPKCYLNFLGGCDRISREHLMTRAVGPAATHLFDRNGHQIADPFPKAEVAKVLCARHNSMLGEQIDPTGVRLHSLMKRIEAREAPFLDVVNGPDLERYLLQRLCAHHYGGVLTSDSKRLRDFKLDEDLVRAAFLDNTYSNGCGLFIVPPAIHFDRVDANWEIAPILDLQHRKIIGVRTTFGGVGFALLLEPCGINGYGPRPLGLRVAKGRKLTLILFTWPGGAETDMADAIT